MLLSLNKQMICGLCLLQRGSSCDGPDTAGPSWLKAGLESCGQSCRLVRGHGPSRWRYWWFWPFDLWPAAQICACLVCGTTNASCSVVAQFETGISTKTIVSGSFHAKQVLWLSRNKSTMVGNKIPPRKKKFPNISCFMCSCFFFLLSHDNNLRSREDLMTFSLSCLHVHTQEGLNSWDDLPLHRKS